MYWFSWTCYNNNKIRRRNSGSIFRDIVSVEGSDRDGLSVTEPPCMIKWKFTEWLFRGFRRELKRKSRGGSGFFHMNGVNRKRFIIKRNNIKGGLVPKHKKEWYISGLRNFSITSERVRERERERIKKWKSFVFDGSSFEPIVVYLKYRKIHT